MRHTVYYLNGRHIDRKEMPKVAKLLETKYIETTRNGKTHITYEKYYETVPTEKEKKEKAEAQRKFFDNSNQESYGDSDEWHGTDNHGWTS